MAFRGERFDVDLEEKSNTSSTGNLVGDIVERTPKAPEPPTFKSGNSSSGWPSHRKRYEKKIPVDDQISPKAEPASFEEIERQDIDRENRQRLAEMSPEEIEKERNELLQSLDPGLVDRLLRRSAKKESSETLTSGSNSTATTAGASRPNSSHSSRRVSFIIPDDEEDEDGAPLERKLSATSHSLPSRGSSTDNLSDYQSDKRPSVNDNRRVSFAKPEVEDDEERQTASRHSISSTTSSVVSRISDESSTPEPQSRPRASSSDRKVSFAVDDPTSDTPRENLKENITAKSHSIALSSPRLSPSKVSNPPSPKRPSTTSSRRVSFADLDPEDLSLERTRSTASRHSLSSPKLAPILDNEGSVHFPKPNMPELDPSSDSFLDDLHSKYFPNLAHDPSKLDWMRTKVSESSYDPSSDSISPKDVRFDFKGKIIAPSTAQNIPTTDGLHHHADAPDSAGYTIAELAHLSRSAFPAQKSMAMQTLGRILYRLGIGEFGDEKKGGEGAILVEGLWKEVSNGRVLDTLKEEASKERGHRTSKAVAEEAVWNWMRGGGKGLEDNQEKKSS